METAQDAPLNFYGCGQYLWVCPVGVAMVPDGNPKKLEPMCRVMGVAKITLTLCTC